MILTDQWFCLKEEQYKQFLQAIYGQISPTNFFAKKNV